MNPTLDAPGTHALAALAARALDFVSNGSVIGVGAGRASTALLRALAAREGAGLRVKIVPASVEMGSLARELGVPVVGLGSDLAVTVDGGGHGLRRAEISLEDLDAPMVRDF